MPAAGTLRRSSGARQLIAWFRIHPSYVIVPAGMGLVAFVGLFELGSKSLWYDEAFTVALARHGWSDIWSIAWGPQEAGNMLLYYLLQHLWLGFGSSEAAVRSLSVVLAIATVPALYLLTKRLFGSWPAAVSILLLALNAFFVQHAQEARAYSLALLLVIVSSTMLLRALEQPTPRRWLAYVACAGLALYAHYFIALIVLAHFVSVLARRPRVPWHQTTLVFGSIGVMAGPLLIAAKAHGLGLSWVPRPTFQYVRETLEILMGSTGDHLLPAAYVLVCAAGIVAALLSRRWRWEWLFATNIVFVPISLALLVSLVTPIFVARFLIVALPGLILLASATFALMRPRWIGAAGVVVLALLAAYGLIGWYTLIPKDGWREAIKYVAEHASPGDGLVAYPAYLRLPVDYYMQLQTDALRTVQPLFPTPAWGRYFPGETDGSSMPTALAGATTKPRRIWVVFRINPPDPSTADGIALTAATRGLPPVTETQFPYVGVRLYEVGP